jgi:chromosome segregation ATPase
MYLQQMRILEEEVCYLQGRIGEEKEAFEESYVELKGEIDRMRGEVEREREEQAEVRSRYEEAVRGLIKAGRTNEQLEGRVQGLERKLEGFQEREGTAARAVSDVQASQMRNLQESYEELLGKWGQVGAVVAKLEEENASLMEEAATLRSEIVTRGTPQPQLLEIPSNFMEFQETIKKTLS